MQMTKVIEYTGPAVWTVGTDVGAAEVPDTGQSYLQSNIHVFGSEPIDASFVANY